MTDILIVLAFLGQLADAATTLHILKRGGRELNPFLRLPMDRVGVVPVLMAKVFLMVCIALWAASEGLTWLVALVAIAGWGAAALNWRRIR